MAQISFPHANMCQPYSYPMHFLRKLGDAQRSRKCRFKNLTTSPHAQAALQVKRNNSGKSGTLAIPLIWMMLWVDVACVRKSCNCDSEANLNSAQNISSCHLFQDILLLNLRTSQAMQYGYWCWHDFKNNGAVQWDYSHATETALSHGLIILDPRICRSSLLL